MSKGASSPWANLQPTIEPGTSRAIRVDAEHPYDFFWALSAKKQPQLVCRLPGCLPFPETKEIPSLKLIQVNFQHLEENSWCIVELYDRAYDDNFHTLCSALVEATRKVTQPQAVLPIILRHLGRWQKLLGRSVPTAMTLQEQLGLFGELSFIHTYVLTQFSLLESIFSWVAPQEHPQDFLLASGAAVEVKCKQATAPEIVHIASQHQLHQPDCPLFLVVFSVSRAEQDQPGVFSLHSLVQTFRYLLANNDPAAEEFEGKLLQRGYIDAPEIYNQHWWRVSGKKCFVVQGDFPRLEPAMLPTGVMETRYTISLADCTPWAQDISVVFNPEAQAHE